LTDAAADAASYQGCPLILAGEGRVESRSERSVEMGMIKKSNDGCIGEATYLDCPCCQPSQTKSV